MPRLFELLYPYRRLELRTHLSAEEAKRALASEVEPARWLSMRSAESKTFAGTLDGDTFEITRVISYRNSFLPQISGTIRPFELGSSISIRMKLSPFVLIFLVIWICVAVQALVATSSRFDNTIAPLFLLGFVWLMTLGGFHFEAVAAEDALVRILDADQTD